MTKLKLSDAAKKAQAAYIKEWRAKNPNKVKQYQISYWERKAAELSSDETMEDKIFRLHKEGFSLRDIAAKVGTNHVQVSRILKSKI